MKTRAYVLIVFVTITLLTALAVLAAALGFFPDASDRLITWGIPSVLGEIVISVVIYFRTSWEQNFRVNIIFDNLEASDVDLDQKNCTYTITDKQGEEIETGNVGINFGPGGWQISLPEIAPNQSIYIKLKANNGDAWELRPFLPFIQTKEAIKSD